MKIKTLEKLVTLDRYYSVISGDIRYFISKRGTECNWNESLKYKPLTYKELMQVMQALDSNDPDDVMWLATDISSLLAKAYNLYLNRIGSKHKADIAKVFPVYRFNLTKSSQCGIV